MVKLSRKLKIWVEYIIWELFKLNFLKIYYVKFSNTKYLDYVGNKKIDRFKKFVFLESK
jgi:hypothetical protein